VDPRSVALRALLMADALAQPAMKKKLAALATEGVCDARCVEDLRDAARMVLSIDEELGDAPLRGTRVPGRLRADAQRLRSAMMIAVERVLHDSDDARLWLDVIRQGRDDGELAFDLRALARLHEQYRPLRDRDGGAAATERARQLADEVEKAVFGPHAAGEQQELTARAWTLLFPQFEEVCRIGRFVLHGAPGIAFPTLATLARAQRRRARPEAGATESPPEQPRREEETTEPRRPPRLPPPGGPESATHPGRGAPLSEFARPDLGAETTAPIDDAVVEIDSTEAIEVPPSGAPPPQALQSACPPTPPEPNRAQTRYNVELEVSIASDSNFYMGFTENLSGGGLFVATHVVRPIGSMIEVSLRLPGRAEPVALRGQVRWIREYSPTSDGWPGMGVRFEAMSEADEALVRAFLQMRDPLFFDE
jgi:uncharacterized protein (TIGR02266 family)